MGCRGAGEHAVPDSLLMQSQSPELLRAGAGNAHGVSGGGGGKTLILLEEQREILLYPVSPTNQSRRLGLFHSRSTTGTRQSLAPWAEGARTLSNTTLKAQVHSVSKFENG